VSDLHDSQRAAFDDDRLLDYALGLDDDPELAAALSHSARLRERLADLKSDLAAIESELRRAIPPVDDTYAEPSAPRWSRLRRSFGESEAGRRPLRGRRLVTSLVAAALAVAIVVGVVAVLPRSPSGSSSSSSAGGAAKSGAVAAPQAGGTAQFGSSGTEAAPLNTGAGTHATSGAAGAAGAVALQAAAYRDVAVVRAGPIRGASQGYTVVRTLKGSPPPSFSLVLRSIESAPNAGSLAVAYLRPLASSTTRSPGATPSPGQPASFSYNGRPALVVALPAGVAASAVSLPK